MTVFAACLSLTHHTTTLSMSLHSQDKVCVAMETEPLPTSSVQHAESYVYSLPQTQSSGPFVPLPELMKRPLHMNRPILTVSLLAQPTPPPETIPTSGILEASQSTASVGSRSKSRNAPTRDAKG